MFKENSIDLIMQVTDSLPDLPKKLNKDALHSDMWAHVNSKYSNEFDIKITKELKDDHGIGCLVNLGGSLNITFTNLKPNFYRIPSIENLGGPIMNYGSLESFDIKENELIMFPTNINYKIVGDNPEILIFGVDKKEKTGNGKSKYRVQITFSDTYYIDVMADSDEHAKDIAYDTDMSNWVHIWPEDKTLERIQSTRQSRWSKKMLESFNIEDESKN